MEWKIVVGAEGSSFDEAVFPIDSLSGECVEAWDDIVPGYQQARYATEEEASLEAKLLRSMGFSSATELVTNETRSQ